MRIYFFFFCPRIANLLSLFYTGKGFFLFFWFSAVGQVFTPYYRGWERRGEEGRGGKRKARLALRLGRRALGTAIREGGERKETGRKDG